MIEVDWARLKAHELRKLANENAVVILPIASIEQHGPHLPISTDSDIVTKIATKLSERINGVLLPTINYGISDEHFPFFNLSIKKSTLSKLIGVPSIHTSFSCP